MVLSNLYFYVVGMAIEILVFTIFAVASLLGFFGGIYFRIPHLYILGCALLIGCGGLLYGFDGLLLDHQLTSVGADGVLTYTDVSITMENTGLLMLALSCVALPIISMLVIDFGGTSSKRSSAFHY